VTPFAVVEQFDVIEDRRPGFIAGTKVALVCIGLIELEKPCI
jgi:hypothetical protein